MTADQVAQRLRITPTRVRQLVHERKLAAPMALSDRVHVWWPVDVEAARALLAGQVLSVRADLLDDPTGPLERMADHLVRYPNRFGEPAVVHVRIWRGDAPEGHRTVVLLGALRESLGLHNCIEDVVTIVSDRFLRGRAEDAVWMECHPDQHAKFRVTNLLLEYPAPADAAKATGSRLSQFLPVPFGSRGDDKNDARPRPEARWRPSEYAAIERVVGSPIEAYPSSAYTADTVERWQSERSMVDYTYDPYGLTDAASALTVLAEVASADPHASTARQACVVLSRACETIVEGYVQDQQWWDDGTGQTFTDDAQDSAPTVYAARLVQPSLTPRERELVAAYAQPDDNTDDEQRSLLQQIWRWSDATGEFGGAHAAPLIHKALATTEQCLARHLGSVHRPTMVRSYDITELEDRFLRSDVVWAEPSGSTTPAHRELAKALLWLSNAPIGDDQLDHVEFGFERHSQLLVARLREQVSAPTARREFAMQWPNDPPSPLREGDNIVAVNSAFRGDLPAFIEHSDGSLEPLARDPRHPYDGWNFGYSGGGPGTLAGAITRVLGASDGDDAANRAHAWIDDQICHSDQDFLRISINDARRRSQPRR
ncbi:hypothetical protein [Gordonia malaquae]|uniref:hypothetical protein n=1 Tax=Gordonia malaquae TaxID=410332 RepID=UPI0030FE2BD4